MTFNCDPDPVVITLTVRYDTPGNATVNGGGLARRHATNNLPVVLRQMQN